MSDVKKLSFADFQRMLIEVQGKPIYRQDKKQFVLEWTGGSFIYQTIVRFTDIETSYEKQYPTSGGDPIVAFKERYLKDCFEELGEYPSNEIIRLADPADPVRENEYSMVRKKNVHEFASFDLVTRNGKKVVVGLRADGTREDFAELDYR